MDAIVHILKLSLERHWVVTIVYQKGSEITRRNIKVLDLTEDSVKAYCYLRNQIRLFKYDNILAVDFCRERAYASA